MGKRKVSAPLKPSAKQTALPPIAARDIWVLGVVVLVVAASFYSGMFWPRLKMLFSVIILAGVLGMLIFGAAKKPLSWSWGHLFGGALVVFYAVGLVNPASANGAVRGVIMWTGFVALYWFVSALGLGERGRKLLLAGIVAGGAVLAMIGLAVYAGVYESPHQLIGGRISAGFEYPNATASWFMVCILVSLAMGWREDCPRWRVFWATTGAVTLPAFLLTLSRGGYLALAVSAVVLAAVCIKSIFALTSFGVLMFVPGLLGTYLFVTTPGLPALLVLPLAALIAAFVEARFVARHARVFGAAALAVICVGGMALAVLGTAGLLPEEVAGYFARITLRGILDDGRFVFIGDGLRALRASPLLGYGGGAWNAVYHSFQTFFYGTARAHSDPLDIALEVGVLGLAVFAAFALLHLYQAWKHRAEPSIAAIGILAFAMLFHSFGEALLAFPAMYLLLFAALGALPAQEKRLTSRLDPRFMLVPVLAVLLILGGGQYLAELELERLPALAQAGLAQEVVTSLQRALRVNPWHADARRELDNQLATQANQAVARRRNLELLVRHEPFDPRATNMLGHWHLAQGNNSQGVEYHERSLALQPRNIQNYETLALSASTAAMDLLARGLKGADTYLEKVLSTYERFRATRDLIPTRLLPQSAVPFEFSPAMALALGEMHAMGGNLAEAIPYLVTAEKGGDRQIAPRAGLMLARVYEKLGRSSEAEVLAKEHATTPDLTAYFDFLRRAIR